MKKKAGNITLKKGTTFTIVESGYVYFAEVTDLCSHTFLYKTDNPDDNGLVRAAPFSAVPYYIKAGRWKDFKGPGEEVKHPSYSAFVMYLHAVKGMTPLQIHDLYPQFKLSNCYACVADCKTRKGWLKKAIADTEKFINKYNMNPYYDKNRKR